MSDVVIAGTTSFRDEIAASGYLGGQLRDARQFRPDLSLAAAHGQYRVVTDDTKGVSLSPSLDLGDLILWLDGFLGALRGRSDNSLL